MDKEYAIKMVEEYNSATLIETLLYNGEIELAMGLIQNCWGDDGDSVIDYIENNWNF